MKYLTMVTSLILVIFIGFLYDQNSRINYLEKKLAEQPPPALPREVDTSRYDGQIKDICKNIDTLSQSVDRHVELFKLSSDLDNQMAKQLDQVAKMVFTLQDYVIAKGAQ